MTTHEESVGWWVGGLCSPPVAAVLGDRVRGRRFWSFQSPACGAFPFSPSSRWAWRRALSPRTRRDFPKGLPHAWRPRHRSRPRKNLYNRGGGVSRRPDHAVPYHPQFPPGWLVFSSWRLLDCPLPVGRDASLPACLPICKSEIACLRRTRLNIDLRTLGSQLAPTSTCGHSQHRQRCDERWENQPTS